MENWNIRKEFKKGVKGFSRVPEKEKRIKRLTFLLSEDQLLIVTRYCNQNEIKLSDFVRSAILEYLQNQKFNLEVDQVDQDKNQLKIFE